MPRVDRLTDKLLRIVSESALLSEALEKAAWLNLPDWHIGAGCIAQTVWNYLHGYDPESCIKDIDLVYFDSADLSDDAEGVVIRSAMKRFAGFPIPIDIKNQARVHLWYSERFGREIEPYESAEHAIDTWPTTSTAIGIRRRGSNLRVYAPYGLDDLFSMRVRPNKLQITKDIYEAKCRKWIRCWPLLSFETW